MGITLANSAPTQRIDQIFFDMDGTLLDLAFDQMIWMQCVPEIWAAQQACSLAEAKDKLYAFYLQHHGQLNWYSSQFWQQQLGIDVIALQRAKQQHIATRPQCFELLTQLRQQGIDCWLLTNADQAALALKLENIALRPYFSHIISSESIGFAKEQPEFWQQLQARHPFNPQRCCLVDDNYAVLACAQRYGIGQLLSIQQPDSTAERSEFDRRYVHLEQLNEVLQYLFNSEESCLS